MVRALCSSLQKALGIPLLSLKMLTLTELNLQLKMVDTQAFGMIFDGKCPSSCFPNVMFSSGRKRMYH